jgi:hypothetical protein
MPRKRTYCARRPGHGGSCIGPEGMQRLRDRAARLRPLREITSEEKGRWNRTWRLKRYGLTPERFQAMLEAQDYACAMCHEPFGEDQRIACCPDNKRSCGRCVRALLCLRCNFIVGYVEQYSEMVRDYLQSLPQMPSMKSPGSVAATIA